MILIFDGTGRLKNSVKRSVKPFVPEAVSETLRAINYEKILELYHNETFQVHIKWQGPDRELPSYIAERLRQSSTGFSSLVRLGLDTLGPRSHKRLAPTPLLLTSNALPTQPQPEPQPQRQRTQPGWEGNLAELLAWEGNLNTAVAAERARELLKILHEKSEELALTKMQLNYYKEKEALEAKVGPTTSPFRYAHPIT